LCANYIFTQKNGGLILLQSRRFFIFITERMGKYRHFAAFFISRMAVTKNISSTT